MWVRALCPDLPVTCRLPTSAHCRPKPAAWAFGISHLALTDASAPGARAVARRPRSKTHQGPADRPRLQPRLGRQPPDPRLRSARRRRLDADGALRAAARVPLRPAGEHDRVAARARRPAARAGAL